ncbi:MAG: rhomboid family intramembrane serine protease [Caulobacterales bacterium]|jgi:membrane associated rhomboid family serine protease
MSGVIPLRAQPRPVLALGALIGLAHLVRGLLPIDAQVALFNRFALISGGFDRPGSDNISALGAAEPWLGHIFLHGGPDSAWTLGLIHVLFNLIIYFQAAPFVYLRLARAGTGALGRFLAIFLASGLGGAALFLMVNADVEKAAVGASGAMCGVFAAYLLSARADWREALADRSVRQSGLVFVGINVVLAAIVTQFGLLPVGIAWEAHLGGFLAGAAAFILVGPRADRNDEQASL